MTALVVIAKACVPGRVKTRLHPPYTLDAAAAIAEASLRHTLHATVDTVADRRILYFDGDPRGLARTGFEIVPQHPGSLDQRIAHLFDQLDEPRSDRHGHSPAHAFRPQVAHEHGCRDRHGRGRWLLGSGPATASR